MHSKSLVFLAVMCAAALSLGGARHVRVPSRAERIAPNDNARRAGRLEKGVLTVAIEARDGEWRPEEDEGPTYKISAFSVAGGPLQTPGPLLRAPVGTEFRVTMHNALAVSMWVYGFGERRGYADSVQVSAGETRELRFRATTPGISYYAARTTSGPVRARITIRPSARCSSATMGLPFVSLTPGRPCCSTASS